MHKSKLAGFIVDCQTDDLQTAASFWSNALGMELRQLPGEEGEKYVELLDASEDMHVEVQSVEHPSRVHLDIEIDDIDAEVARLIELGAAEVKRVKRWCVMEAPTGQRFCVVTNRTDSFADRANEW